MISNKSTDPVYRGAWFCDLFYQYIDACLLDLAVRDRGYGAWLEQPDRIDLGARRPAAAGHRRRGRIHRQGVYGDKGEAEIRGSGYFGHDGGFNWRIEGTGGDGTYTCSGR